MKGESILERRTKQQQELPACPGVLLITSMEAMRGWGSITSVGTQESPGAGSGATPPPARRLDTVGSGLVVGEDIMPRIILRIVLVLQILLWCGHRTAILRLGLESGPILSHTGQLNFCCLEDRQIVLSQSQLKLHIIVFLVLNHF